MTSPRPIATTPAGAISDLVEASVPTRTLVSEVAVDGVGIHSGAPCRVRLFPQPAGHGIAFVRKGRRPVPATWRTANAEASDRRTVLVGEDGERFEQVEHLMAALAAMDISDLLIEQEGPELPFLGGGSREFMDALRSVGTTETEGSRPVLTIRDPISLQDGNALLTASPHDGLWMSCFVEFPGTVVGNMGVSLELTEQSFYDQVSPARTFAVSRDIEMLRSMGLIKGGNLQNALVFDEKKYHNESLHFADEVPRHKVIDLLGDLALLGCSLRGHFWAWRAGHRSHVRFAQLLAKEFHLAP